MSDWIGLGFIVLLVIGAIVGLSVLGKPYEVTREEFDKRAHEAQGMMGAGLMGLQKFLDPAQEKAIAAQEDFKQGYLDGEQESGEGKGKKGEGESEEHES
jgi:hypothetical protein